MDIQLNPRLGNIIDSYNYGGLLNYIAIDGDNNVNNIDINSGNTHYYYYYQLESKYLYKPLELSFFGKSINTATKLLVSIQNSTDTDKGIDFIANAAFTISQDYNIYSLLFTPTALAFNIYIGYI